MKFLKEWADLFIYNKIPGLIKNGTFSHPIQLHHISDAHVIESENNDAEW